MAQPDTQTTSWERRDALMRALFEVLAEAPDGMHWSDAFRLVRERLPARESELAPVPSSPEMDKYTNQLLWYTVAPVKAAWLEKKRGTWRLTETGREALRRNTAPRALADEAGAAYNQWLRDRESDGSADGHAGKWELLIRALQALPTGTWTSYTDLGELVGTSPSTVGWWLTNNETPNAFRVLQVDGSLDESHSSQALGDAGVTLSASGRADPAGRVRADVLRELLGLDVAESEVQRAWLVRGSSVNGYNLVPVWLERGSCSLAASHLTAIDPPVSRDDLRLIVDRDYAHVSYNARNEKVAELDTFLNRMREGDVVLTTSGGEIYIGDRKSVV